MSSMRPSTLQRLAFAASLSVAAVSVVHAQSAPSSPPATTAPDAQSAANSQADQARAALAAANTHAAAIAARLDADRQQTRETIERLSRADAALPEIQAKIDSATARLSARQREMGLEDVRYAPLKFADDRVRLDAIGDFEKSPEYRAGLQGINDAAAALGNVQADSLRRFAATDEYQQAVKAPPSADASARLEGLKAQRLAADPNVVIAQSRLAGAKAALDGLRTRFMEQQLPQIPQVADADQKLTTEQAAYDALASAAKTAERDLADGRALLDRQHAGLDADRAALVQLTAQISQLQTDLAAAQTSVAQTSDDVNRATVSADAAQQNRDNALAAGQQQNSAQLIVPSTTYEYAPPTVVYPAPATVYAPAPLYYGNVFIVPYRGYGYGYAGGYRGYQGHADFHGGHAAHGGGHR